ncbi:MAG TPA: CsgG/HfaB family protein [Methylibium sp.]|uniref:CsgG/HfaB family protein n=1 Tax=Methylibium sp. TaxID=2067992 RepID=UPI002DBCB514|nr:CsgG/HfaB family protein [Methylibium sp.]HEU4457940.1 CsgG/HfaB family protein [Methylibium sp.]
MSNFEAARRPPEPARLASRALALGSALLLGACMSTTPEVGGGSKGAVTGAAGGATTANANSNLESCGETLGTIAVVEDQGASWYGYYRSRYGQLGSTVPVLRMMIQQSNCFVVVERGAAMRNMQQERALEQSGEMRAGSNFGRGQMVAADYSMSPSIQFSDKTGGARGAVSGLANAVGLPALGWVGGSLSVNEASTTLLMVDNRSGVQLAAAEGTARNFDFGAFGGAYGWATGASASGYAKTPEGKVIVAAFVDSYNQLVKAVRNYKAQTVKGGLGTGGALGVQGGSTPASQQSGGTTQKKK